MKITPDRQKRWPNSVKECWEALDNDTACLVGFNGEGDGLCEFHARAEFKRLMLDGLK